MSERFRRLLPDPADGLTATDVAAAIPAPSPEDRPFLAVNMIATADGRASIAGRTAPIANRADYELFHALRTRVDAVMVGAQTVRVEGYGRMVPAAAARAARERAGLAADPVAVLVSRSLDLDPQVGLLRTPENRVVALTPSPDAELPPCAARVAYLREGDLARAMRRLRAEHGVRSMLSEGGPQLLAALLAAGVVDELHLVIAAKLAGGVEPLTIVNGPALDPPLELALLSLHESGGFLFARYGV